MPNNATPPVPWTSTVCPARTPPRSTSANQAVNPATGNVLASASSRLSGARTSQSSGKTRYSAMTPGSSPPSARYDGVRASPAVRSSIQPGMKVEITRSPVRKRLAPSPRDATAPAMSDPGVKGNASGAPMPFATIMTSRWLSEMAAILTSTSPRPGSGTGAACRRRLARP